MAAEVQSQLGNIALRLNARIGLLGSQVCGCIRVTYMAHVRCDVHIKYLLMFTQRSKKVGQLIQSSVIIK